MRLKSLDLVGFKSFLEPTTIGFTPGITAVVGPNGCGKSNVVDAIRWVLGEQAPTRLRGKSAEDLIYAGNDSNPAAGMAEVSLLLEAEEGSPLPEPYAGLSEVCVTRRVYRSGESEYLLNRIPCRLKDITEFFMAAQIHSRGYALIEQGRIEEIIQAKPTELRGLVEEAAGLSLFKGRREMSERKLERVRENLARVDDVLGEIERQLAFARRQARKAEAYKAIRQELDELERLSAAHRLLEERARLEHHRARAAALEAQRGELSAALAGLQSQTDADAVALAAHRDRLAALSNELDNLRAAIAQRGHTRAFLERRLRAAEAAAPELAARLDELQTKATAARAARAEAGARLARERNADDGGEATLAELRVLHEAAAAALREAERTAEEARDEVAEQMREAAALRGRLGALGGERAELAERLGLAEARMPALEAAVGAAHDALGTAGGELAARRSELERAEERERAARARENAARTALDASAARLALLREALGVARARAERLAARAGSGAAAERLRVVLESLNGDGPAERPAMLSEVLRAPAALRHALGAVLGEQAEAVIVDSPHLALRAIEILKENRAGRLSFIPDPGPVDSHPAIEAPGIAGRLLDMLEVEPRFRPAAEAMLGHVIVADDLRAALAASNLNGHGTLFVTREGDLVWPGRMIAGGSVGLPDGAGADDEPLDAHALEEAAARVEQTEADAARLRADLDAAHAELEVAQRELGAAHAGLTQAERAIGERQNAIERAQAESAAARSQHEQARARLDEIARLMTECNARLEELAHAEAAGRERLGALRTGLAEHKHRAERAAAAMLEAAGRVEARRTHLRAIEQELGHLRRLADEHEAQIAKDRAALERLGAERGELAREVEQIDEQDRASAAREAELAAETAAMRAACEAAAAALAERRTELAQARERGAALEREAMECALGCERARTLAEELERTFAEKFQIAFAEVESDLTAALAARDVAADEARLVELRAKAERLGEVNLAAESEVKELEERAAVLNSERADLEAALKDLSQTIQKLNREARRRFNETFEGAARNFAELFPKLLRGGKGRLELMPADDVLEAGVNILVQPPGKKVKEIGLLSGGEKALCAMALIFSLFLLNPSPFCVMDEVDAPLDEFSLAAFTSLIGELKQRSQFIVITHNQRTMQRADHIHGVTMERPGVSRLISLEIPRAA
ncbi:MAG TPA: chromosome segregation protein SMC [Candidatus Binataceae bacterium]|nr:chromosome segregation protein SMC [Candidatus Binataceae bacterium]